MPVELSTLYKDIFGAVYDNKGVNGICSNLLYVSMLITVIIILIVVIVYPCKKGTSMWLLFKLYLYILFVVFGFVALYEGFIIHTFQTKHSDNKLNNMVNSFKTNELIYGNDMVKISPKIGAGYETDDAPITTSAPSFVKKEYDVINEELDNIINSIK